MKDFMEYSCGKMEQGTWISSSRFLLNQLKEEGCNYPKYQMYEAYLCHVEGEEEQAKEILRRFKDQTFLREDLEMAGAYLYLCTLPDCTETESRQCADFAISPCRERTVSCYSGFCFRWIRSLGILHPELCL